MAVSGATAAPHEIPYYLGADKPPDMAAVTKAMAERIDARLPQVAHSTALKLEPGHVGSVTLTWPKEFPDTSYRVGLSVLCGVSVPTAATIVEKTKAKIVVSLRHIGELTTTEFTVEAIAVHD